MAIATQEIKETTEIRTIPESNFEIRTQEDGSKSIEGYAMKWDQLSLPLGFWFKFREKFTKGSFRDYLSDNNNDTKFLIGHNINQVLGRRKNSTLELNEDDTGLFFRLKLPDTTMGNDTFESVKRGDVDKISVGFKVIKEEWDETDENDIKRTITKANLPEISLTAWPAYESTSASARSVDDAYKQYREVQTSKEDEIKKHRQRQKFLRNISL